MTPLAHAAEMLALVVVVAGPVPLALAWAHEDTTRSAGHRVLLTLLAWMALQSGVALGLVLAGWLRLVPTLLVEALLSAAGAAALRGRQIDLRPAQPLSAVERLTIISIGLLGASLLLRFAAQPITENDSLGYHLTPMARWVQAGALVSIERSDQAAYYLYGWELLSTLFLLPLQEDFLVISANILAWAMLGLASYLIARRLDAPRLHALAAVFALLAMPVVRAQLAAMRVDLALAAFFVTAVFFALRREFVPCLAATALLVSAKTSAPLYATLVAGTWMLAPPHRRGSQVVAGRFLVGPIVVTASLAAGGFWYLPQLGGDRESARARPSQHRWHSLVSRDGRAGGVVADNTGRPVCAVRFGAVAHHRRSRVEVRTSSGSPTRHRLTRVARSTMALTAKAARSCGWLDRRNSYPLRHDALQR